jgi:hypothetical protein
MNHSKICRIRVEPQISPATAAYRHLSRACYPANLCVNIFGIQLSRLIHRSRPVTRMGIHAPFIRSRSFIDCQMSTNHQTPRVASQFLKPRLPGYIKYLAPTFSCRFSFEFPFLLSYPFNYSAAGNEQISHVSQLHGCHN